MEKDLDGSGCDLIVVVLLHLPAGTEKNHENLMSE
jgi:hypothetical protein